jgi:hypothetical protein
MDQLEVFGDVIICLSIIAGAVTFIIANVNYRPDEKDES